MIIQESADVIALEAAHNAWVLQSMLVLNCLATRLKETVTLTIIGSVHLLTT